MTAESAYFDYAATTPPDARVLAEYSRRLQEGWGNPAAPYARGLAAKALLEDARARFAAAVGAAAAEIVFTSGATEADNLALKGVLTYHGTKQPSLITLQSEHKAVLDTAAALGTDGVRVKVLPVGRDGLLDLACLQDELAAQTTTLVSVMAVNNETGVVQPLRAIADLAHRYGAKFHIDAAQAPGKMPVDVAAWDADAVSFSGHKVYAPQGIGALYVRRMPKLRLAALLHGGGQERGRRSGTPPVALIAAFATALELAAAEFIPRLAQVEALAEKLIGALPPLMRINGTLEKAQRVPHILNVNTGLPVSRVLAAADAAQLALSAGSACQSAVAEGSHVLQAMGLQEAAVTSLRISLSHLTTAKELDVLQRFLQELR